MPLVYYLSDFYCAVFLDNLVLSSYFPSSDPLLPLVPLTSANCYFPLVLPLLLLIPFYCLSATSDTYDTAIANYSVNPCHFSLIVLPVRLDYGHHHNHDHCVIVIFINTGTVIITTTITSLSSSPMQHYGGWALYWAVLVLSASTLEIICKQVRNVSSSSVP
jgi:hypothetical protein